MADNEKKGEEGTSSRGADWEVVSLTASAYAAAPGPSEFDTASESKEENITEHESSAALFMSGHFLFPPTEHEKLPIEPDINEIHGEPERQCVSSAMVDDDNVVDNSGREKLQTESNDDLHGVEFSDEGSKISVHDMGFEGGMGFQRLNLVGMEQGVLADTESVAFHSGAHKSGTKFEVEEPSNINMDSPPDHTKPNEDESDGSDFPCKAWWKRHAASLYHQAKETNTFWSVVVAATVMGLVILGRRWQREKWQLHQIKWRSSINDERMSGMLGPISRFKDVLVGGHHRGPLIDGIRASASF